MNFSGSIMSGMGISLGSLEIATDYLWEDEEESTDKIEQPTNIKPSSTQNKPGNTVKSTKQDAIDRFSLGINIDKAFDKPEEVFATFLNFDDEDNKPKQNEESAASDIYARMMNNELMNSSDDDEDEDEDDLFDLDEDDEDEADGISENNDGISEENEDDMFDLDEEDEDDDTDNSDDTNDNTDGISELDSDELDIDIEDDEEDSEDASDEDDMFDLDEDELFGDDEDADEEDESSNSTNSVTNVNNIKTQIVEDDADDEEGFSLEDLSIDDDDEDEDTEEDIEIDTDNEDIAGDEEDGDILFDLDDDDEEDEEIEPPKPVATKTTDGISKQYTTSHTESNSSAQADEIEQLKAQIASMQKTLSNISSLDASKNTSGIDSFDNNKNNSSNTVKKDTAGDNTAEPEVKVNNFDRYTVMTTDELYRHVRKALVKLGVAKGPVDLAKLNSIFGEQNIKKLIQKSYLIKIGKGVTTGYEK